MPRRNKRPRQPEAENEAETKAKQQSSFSDLPSALLSLIFSFIAIFDRRNFRRFLPLVCKSWCEAEKSASSWPPNVTIDHEWRTKHIVHFIPHFEQRSAARPFKSITVDTSDLTAISLLRDTKVEELKFTFHARDEWDQVWVMTHANRIKRLTIQNSRSLFGLVPELSALESLSFEDCEDSKGKLCECVLVCIWSVLSAFTPGTCGRWNSQESHHH